MTRLAAIRPSPEKNPHRLGAMLASCVFHAVVLAILVIVLCRPARPLPNGSAAAAPTITLSKLVIIAAPLPPAPVKKVMPTPIPPKPVSTPPPAVVKMEPAKIPVPEGLPVLAMQPKVAEKETAAKPHPAHHLPSPAPIASNAPAPSPVASSHATGENVFPHPPYPEEARFLHETGTVVVNVRFSANGKVAQVQVAQSSGVPLLDAQTRSFIREHWHTPVYAGQMLRVPVEYTLDN